MELNLPSVIFGTSGLGNLFIALEEEEKLNVVKECIRLSKGKVVFDSAGKYGAGLALEVLGKFLKKLDVAPQDVIISNKLAWLRTELKTNKPTFEPGIWKNLKYDAVQKISYDGIVQCFEQGNELLGGYIPQMVSVHDPDEYLALAKDKQHEEQLYQDILEAYKALFHLKKQGKVKAVGVGAKDWKAIRRIAEDVPFDWVMIANSMTIKNHPSDLLEFMAELERRKVTIINAAVFHSGFLVGGDYFDYTFRKRGTPENDDLYQWRTEFFGVCKEFKIKPAAACIQFALHAPGVNSIALNTTDVERIKENIEYAEMKIPLKYWKALKSKGLIDTIFLKKM